MLKKIKSRADIVSRQNSLTFEFIQRRILLNKKKNLHQRTSVTAQTFVSLSYKQGKIIHIYHNQNLTSIGVSDLSIYLRQSLQQDFGNVPLQLLKYTCRGSIFKREISQHFQGAPLILETESGNLCHEKRNAIIKLILFACKYTWSKEVSILLYGLLY